jgi:hypothetical protein
MEVTLFNNGCKSDPTIFSIYSSGHSRLIVTSMMALKVSSIYNIGHNKCKGLLPTKLQFKADKNPKWPESLMLFPL